MNKTGFGLAVGGFLDGVIATYFLETMSKTMPQYALFFILINLAATVGIVIFLADKDFIFLITWLFGAIIISTTGLMSIIDIMVYIVLPLTLMTILILKRFKG
ncbi:MAG: hypothetical protein WCI04_02195 [archaeon]